MSDDPIAEPMPATVDDRAQWSTSIVLSDGDTAFIRPITTADAPLLLQFHERQPRENLYRRFLSPKPSLSPKELAHFTDIDFHDRVALVVEHRGEFIAWASYERWKSRDDAEVAFMVDEAHQGRGIATLLLEHLAAIARSNGVQRFTAEALSDNRAMLRVFSRAGWPVEKHFDSGLTEIEFPLKDNERFLDSVEQREHRADSRAVARLLLPKSIAVIGASDAPHSIGRELWRNASSFDGPVYPVNPNQPTVGGVTAFASIADIADDVWLAIVAVPVAALVDTIEQCIAKRVRGAVIITSVDGSDVDVVALIDHARRNGLRLVGPASMGIASTQPGGVQGALVPVGLRPGGVAISMQSGSLGASLLQLASQLSMGVSWFVSLGDKCDISGNDLLQFWEDDESTTVIALYTESFGNPRKFARIARRVGRTRPIVAVRTGTAAIGNAANALYQQAGLIEVPTVRAMLDVARVLATQPVPTGPRVAILTNARSPGVLARAAVLAAGLTVVDPPVALDFRSTADDIAAALSSALADDGIDAVMLIHAPPIASAYSPVIEIDAAAAGASKLLLAVMLGREDGPLLPRSNVPSFSFPESAAAVIGRMWTYSRWLQTEADPTIEAFDDADVPAARHIVRTAMDAGELALSFTDMIDLFRAYGLSASTGVVTVGNTPAEIGEVATALGFPVVVKATKRRIGRSARAGIALDIADAHAAAEAVTIMRDAIGADADSIVVQQMAVPGVDVRILCTTDEMLGPVVTLDLGSLQDIGRNDGASRLAPVSRAGAETLIATSRVGATLAAAGLDSAALIEAIMHVSRVAVDHAEIMTIDVNPLIVSDAGCTVTDARVELRATHTSDRPLRRLG